MERNKRGERRRERDEEGMREIYMGELMGERRRETEKEIERERRGSVTDVPKLYTYNEYEHSVSVLK